MWNDCTKKKESSRNEGSSFTKKPGETAGALFLQSPSPTTLPTSDLPLELYGPPGLPQGFEYSELPRVSGRPLKITPQIHSVGRSLKTPSLQAGGSDRLSVCPSPQINLCCYPHPRLTFLWGGRGLLILRLISDRLVVEPFLFRG